MLMDGLSVGAHSVKQAFKQAYASAGAARTGAGAAAADSDFRLKKSMAVDEAGQILNVDPDDMSLEEVHERFDKMFAANEVEDGGSFYLQSKIYRAKVALEEALPEQDAAAAAAATSEGGDAGDAAAASGADTTAATDTKADADSSAPDADKKQ